MQPMKPDDIAQILNSRPGVTHADIQEYQRLQGERLATNPHLPKTDEQLNAHDARNARLQELHAKLFGNG